MKTSTLNQNPVLVNRNSIDKMMSPRADTLLNANLLKPDFNVPIEILSPQVKPFLPIVTPQLNAINPELREIQLFIFELLPVVLPIPVGSRSRSSSRAPTNLRN